MDNLAAYIGRKWRYVGATSQNSSNGVYEAEAIGFVPRGKSLYKDFPSFCGYITYNGAKAVVDVSQKYDRIIMRNPDGKLAAVHTGRIYEEVKERK